LPFVIVFWLSLLELSIVKNTILIKPQAMKKQHMHQEVLVSTRTTLVKKVLFETNDSNKNATSLEKFEEACWNDFLNEIFSELMPYSSSPLTKIFIWGIHAGKSYLLIDLADAPDTIESVLSIDPHLFLPEVDSN
jgi:hypothetical protein